MKKKTPSQRRLGLGVITELNNIIIEILIFFGGVVEGFGPSLLFYLG